MVGSPKVSEERHSALAMVSLGKEAREAEHLSCEWSTTTSDLMVILVIQCVKSGVFTRNIVTSTNPSSVSAHAWEESTGLLASLIPQANGVAANYTNPHAFNAAKGDLKLGPAPMSEELRTETERLLREQAMVDRDPSAQYEIQLTRPVVPGTIAPTEADLPPHPATFKTKDVEREVANVRDARKRIRLEPSTLGSIDFNSPQASAMRARALPSICAYTLHDVAEGCVAK